MLDEKAKVLEWIKKNGPLQLSHLGQPWDITLEEKDGEIIRSDRLVDVAPSLIKMAYRQITKLKPWQEGVNHV